MRSADIALAVLPPALWAVAYTIAKPAMAIFPPLLLMSMVYTLTALCLFKPWRGRYTPLWALVTAATLGASIQSALIFNGIALVPASTAILVVQSQVPFAVLAAWAIGQEQLNARRILGIAVSFVGVAAVVGFPDSVGETRGLLLIVASTLCWGIAQGIIRATSRDEGKQLMGWMSAVAAPQMLLLSLLLERGQARAILNAGWLDWICVAILALGGFVAAYAIWYGLLRRYRVDEVAPFVLLMPAIGVLIALLFLREPPSFTVLAGGGIILLGLVLVVGMPSATKTRTT